jgi:hypothetical protein
MLPDGFCQLHSHRRKINPTVATGRPRAIGMNSRPVAMSFPVVRTSPTNVSCQLFRVATFPANRKSAALHNIDTLPVSTAALSPHDPLACPAAESAYATLRYVPVGSGAAYWFGVAPHFIRSPVTRPLLREWSSIMSAPEPECRKARRRRKHRGHRQGPSPPPQPAEPGRQDEHGKDRVIRDPDPHHALHVFVEPGHRVGAGRREVPVVPLGGPQTGDANAKRRAAERPAATLQPLHRGVGDQGQADHRLRPEERASAGPRRPALRAASGADDLHGQNQRDERVVRRGGEGHGHEANGVGELGRPRGRGRSSTGVVPIGSMVRHPATPQAVASVIKAEPAKIRPLDVGPAALSCQQRNPEDEQPDEGEADMDREQPGECFKIAQPRSP